MNNPIGQVLGTETYRDLVTLVNGLVQSSWSESYTTRDMRVVAIALLVVLALVSYQVFHHLSNHRHRRSWGSILGMIIFDFLAFWVLIGVQLSVYYWMLDVRSPRNVVIERLTPELVSVRYQTYDPELGIVYWGYEAERLSFAALDQYPAQKSRKHEILVTAEPGREVYLKIWVGNELYGLNNSRHTSSYGVAGTP